MRPPTPLKLKRLLTAIGTSQDALCAAIRLQDGCNPSAYTVGQIANRNLWPARTPKAWLQSQIEEFLQRHGADKEDIKTACEIDDDQYQPRITDQSSTRKAQAKPPIKLLEPQLPEKEMLTQEAKQHFKLFRDPFKDDIQGPDDVFLSDSQRNIREAMFITAKHGGFLAVVGESGAGKSVLRRELIDRIRREGHPITCIMPRIIDKGRLTAGAICDSIIQDVSLEHPKCTLEAKARQIEELLSGSSQSGNSHVLLIEEAHDLSVHTLKYLKRFWELEDGFRKLLSIILVGQPELKDKLDERKNWGAREVIRRVELAELFPLNGDLEAYLELKMKRFDRSLESVFEPNAFDAIRKRLTYLDKEGKPLPMHYPLVVNNLVVKCMNLVVSTGSLKINAEIVAGV
ncbi:MAG: AAA family ATPase [Candidatus Sedimenticola sp. (ex Thyasira tokunagai)]